MPKRGRPRGTAADVVPAKQNRDEQQRIIVCGLYDQGRTAVAKCLLQELKSAMVLACDLRAGRRAVPKKAGAFEVRAYTEETPQLPSQDLLHAVVLSHVLARPSLMHLLLDLRMTPAGDSQRRPQESRVPDLANFC